MAAIAQAPATAPPEAAPYPPSAIDAVSHGAIAFAQVYYEAYDEPTRRATELPALHLPDSKVVWNGTAVPAPQLGAWLAALPSSRHDLQTLDAHPLPPPNPASPNPDILVTITGSVLLGPSVFAPAAAADKAPSNAAHDMPRKFAEVFVLRAVAGREGLQPMYAIQSTNFRFIG
ncbi:hypothetical protein Q5752_001195 [Cryptotrichosporon argae]